MKSGSVGQGYHLLVSIVQRAGFLTLCLWCLIGCNKEETVQLSTCPVRGLSLPARSEIVEIEDSPAAWQVRFKSEATWSDVQAHFTSQLSQAGFSLDEEAARINSAQAGVVRFNASEGKQFVMLLTSVPDGMAGIPQGQRYRDASVYVLGVFEQE